MRVARHDYAAGARDGDQRDGVGRLRRFIEDEQVTWHRVKYDYRTTMEKINATRVLSEVLARRLSVGK